MKEQIFEIIKAHPGVRLREIAGYIHIWHLNKYFLKAIRELEMIDNKQGPFSSEHVFNDYALYTIKKKSKKK